MLQRSQTSTEKYKIKPATTVSVKNVETDDGQGGVLFKTTVTLKHVTHRDTPLTFEDGDAISDYVLNIDLLDDQTAMELNDGK